MTSCTEMRMSLELKKLSGRLFGTENLSNFHTSVESVKLEEG